MFNTFLCYIGIRDGGRCDIVEGHYVQLCQMNVGRLFSKPYVNEVTLTRQNLPLKCCQLLELWTQLKRNLDFSMLKIWCL